MKWNEMKWNEMKWNEIKQKFEKTEGVSVRGCYNIAVIMVKYMKFLLFCWQGTIPKLQTIPIIGVFTAKNT